jgi:hypothetical protein
VNRKWKILFVVALVIAGIAVFALCLPKQKAAVSVLFNDAETNKPFLTSFIFTNMSSHVFVRYKTSIQVRDEVWRSLDASSETRSFMGFDDNYRQQYIWIGWTNRWRICVSSYAEPADSIAYRIRSRWALWVEKRDLRRLAQWIMPEEHWQTAYGPEMLGNKPAPVSDK